MFRSDFGDLFFGGKTIKMYMQLLTRMNSDHFNLMQIALELFSA